MVYDALRTLLESMEVLRPALTEPGYRNATVVFAGWVLTCGGRHAVTQALVATQVAGRRHHEAFHRLFSRGTWIPDQMGRLPFDKIVSTMLPANASIRVALDDTLATKKGPEVFGIGSHLDPVRSTKEYRVFAFGHVWVVMAVLVQVPFSRRLWALPVLFRLYRNKKDCLNDGGRYRKKTELAAEMVRIVASKAQNLIDGQGLSSAAVGPPAAESGRNKSLTGETRGSQTRCPQQQRFRVSAQPP